MAIRFAFLLALAAGQHMEPIAAPAKAVRADYPVHVRVLTVKGRDIRGTFQGYGHGDILGPKPQGFNYSFNCPGPLVANTAQDEFYQAKWNKQDLKLELLTQKPGNSHTATCELNVALTATPFAKYPVTE